ncbi:50S ribosomal protein L18 [Candidatus Pacearchaeota archaeon]|nr:50S ribosomal protein L18 [Candidatus Pacearchaeota archaeon]
MTKTQKRRRKEMKTDYKARFALLKSEKPRLVVRKTAHQIIAQVVESSIAQDKVIVSVNSKELLKKGWPKEKEGSLKSIQASYLAGFLLGKKVQGKINSAILDIGLHENIHGSRIYAVLKGAIDAGLNVAHKKDALPTDERMSSNKILYDIMKKVKEKL